MSMSANRLTRFQTAALLFLFSFLKEKVDQMRLCTTICFRCQMTVQQQERPRQKYPRNFLCDM